MKSGLLWHTSNDSKETLVRELKYFLIPVPIPVATAKFRLTIEACDDRIKGVIHGDGMRINTRETILKELRRLKPEFERRYGVTRIGIFGSFARNEIREDSDIDIVVEMQPDLIKRATLKAELESIFGKRIDVVRYRRGMNGFLKKRIDEDASLCMISL